MFSVTEVLAIIDKPALKFWANKIGLQGIKIKDFVSKKNLLGTEIHKAIEKFLITNEKYTDEDDKKMKLFNIFYSWYIQNEIKVIAIEKLYYSKLFCGKVDAVLKINDENTLIDFKITNDVYNETIYQLSAYYKLLQENSIKIKKVKIFHINPDTLELNIIELSKQKVIAGFNVFQNALNLKIAINELEEICKSKN